MNQSWTKFSRSKLWTLLQKTYEDWGVESWTQKKVPFHRTNNARYASCCVELLSNKKKPFRVLELGGGAGIFAYLFCQMAEERGLEGHYLLSDGAEKNVAFWKKHPQLQLLEKRGKITFQKLDPFQEKIAGNFDLVVANYFFDSCYQDLVFVKEGQCFEGEVRFEMGESFEALKVEYRAGKEVSSVKGVDLSKEGPCLVPTGALQVLENLQEALLPQGCVVIADRMGSFPELKVHGSFSYPVNLAFLEECFGGQLFVDEGFGVGVFRNKAPLDWKIETYSQEKGSFQAMLKVFEAWEWDPQVFFAEFSWMQKAFDQVSSEEKCLFLEGAKKVERLAFELGSKETELMTELAFFLESQGGFLAELKNYRYQEEDLRALLEQVRQDEGIALEHVERFLDELKEGAQISEKLWQKARREIEELS